jgi:hypothetical protein
MALELITKKYQLWYYIEYGYHFFEADTLEECIQVIGEYSVTKYYLIENAKNVFEKGKENNE